MKDSHILILVVAIIIILVAWAIIDRSGSGSIAERLPAQEITEHDWTKGAQQGEVALIEYSDFQCPACKSYYPVVKQLMEEYQDSVTLAYRHYPLRSIHPNAQIAAQAAEAAGKQGKFWEMHDKLFDEQSDWSSSQNPEEAFGQYAQELGLNVEQFIADLSSREVRNAVNNYYSTAVGAGINSTPTFFLNGTQIKPPASYQQFSQLIEDALAS